MVNSNNLNEPRMHKLRPKQSYTDPITGIVK